MGYSFYFQHFRTFYDLPSPKYSLGYQYHHLCKEMEASRICVLSPASRSMRMFQFKPLVQYLITLLCRQATVIIRFYVCKDYNEEQVFLKSTKSTSN